MLCLLPLARAQKTNGIPPNVILVLTDDQGYADFGFHGNSQINTPHLDRFARNHISFSRFYVSTVCAPTRASLLTGRYNYRTGVTGVNPGQFLMNPKEVTLAEIFKKNGYRTGIFGKWHLGNNYPMRAMDQGFDESLVHLGGAMGISSDYPGNSYFDPILIHNGLPKKYDGYCADIFSDAAINFLRKEESPFFILLAPNTPHLPPLVPERYSAPYRKNGLTEKESIVYGMVTNIDDNFGKLLSTLKDLGKMDNTIIIYMSDNGADFARRDKYNGGLKGDKGTPYEGGLKVPFLMKIPKQNKPLRLNQPIAHIDVFPTLMDLCQLQFSTEVDGISFAPYIKTGIFKENRNLYLQWHPGDEPQLHKGISVIGPKFKLVQSGGGGFINRSEEVRFELFDITKDSLENDDLSPRYPKKVQRMSNDYEQWFYQVTSSLKGYKPLVILDHEKEPQVFLSKHESLTHEKKRLGWRIKNPVRKYFKIRLHAKRAFEKNDTLRIAFGAQRFEFKLNSITANNGWYSCSDMLLDLEAQEDLLTVQIKSKKEVYIPDFIELSYYD